MNTQLGVTAVWWFYFWNTCLMIMTSRREINIIHL